MSRSLCAESGNDCDAQLHEFGCQGRKPVVLALCPAIFDLHILTVYKACFFQTLPKCIHEESGVGRSNRAQKSNGAGTVRCWASAANGSTMYMKQCSTPARVITPSPPVG